jgi:hypothetical protein
LVINWEILGIYKRSVSSKYFMKLVMLDMDIAYRVPQASQGRSKQL